MRLPSEDVALFDAAKVSGVDAFAAIRAEQGNVSVKTIEWEVLKLTAICAVGLLEGPYADVRAECIGFLADAGRSGGTVVSA